MITLTSPFAICPSPEWHSNNLSDSERDRSYVEEQSETRAINDTAKVKKKSRARTAEEKEMAAQHDADLAKVSLCNF